MLFNDGGDDPSNARHLPHDAATAVAFGFPREKAVAAMTLEPAKLLGVGDRLGSLEAGKDATFILTDGDVLDLRSRVVGAYLDGRALDLTDKQKRLYEKYRNRPPPAADKTQNGRRTMNFLFKEEPTHYAFDDLVRDGKTSWTGVKNPVAQKNLRTVRKGDRIFYYHTGDEKAVVGIAKAAGDAYADPKDPSGKLYAVDVAPVKKLPAPGHARGDQGQGVLQGLPARPDLAALGHAGLGPGVERDREDGGTLRAAGSTCPAPRRPSH